MLKIHHDHDDEEIYRQEGGMMLKLVTEPGGLVKSASSDVFMKEALEQFKPDKDHFMAHLIAMGDGETYGENKNNDYWPKKANEERHPTFLKYGYFYREHKNRGKKDSIGLIKASAYNPHQKRIELVIWGNVKSAAEEFETIKAGGALSFSMSARVPFDKCNCCGQETKKAKDYCSHLKQSRRQYVPEFRKYAYAINDFPTFYDISKVARPADRIAHHLQFSMPDSTEEMRKAASEDIIISGAEWAELDGVNIPDFDEPWKFTDITKQASLQHLENAEKRITDQLSREGYTTLSLIKSAATDTSTTTMDVIKDMRPGTLFRMLAKRAAVLPFHEFCAYVQGRSMEDVRSDSVVKKASGLLVDLFGSMSDGCCCDKDLDSMFSSDSSVLSELDPGVKCDAIDDFMSEADRKFGVSDSAATQRITITITKSASTNLNEYLSKQASAAVAADEEAASLAHAYGLYKVSALSDIREFHPDMDVSTLAAHMALQNFAAIL